VTIFAVNKIHLTRSPILTLCISALWWLTWREYK